MKKFKFALLAMATMMLSVGFTACGDDNDEPSDPTGGDEPQVEEQVPRSAMVRYYFDPTSDMLEVYDVYVYYFDRCEIQSRQITGKTEFTCNTLVLPGMCGYKVVTKMKEGYVATRDSYDIRIEVDLSNYAVYDQNGKVIEALTHPGTTSKVGRTEVTAEGLATFDGHRVTELVYEIGTDGKMKIIQNFDWDNY